MLNVGRVALMSASLFIATTEVLRAEDPQSSVNSERTTEVESTPQDERPAIADQAMNLQERARSSRRHLAKELNSITQLDIANSTLEEACQFIARKHRLNIHFAKSALNRIRLDPRQVPVSVVANDVALRTVLRQLLADTGAIYRVEGNVISITAPNAVPVILDQSPTEAYIRQCLTDPFVFNFDQVRVVDMAQALSQALGIAVLIDKPTFAIEGLSGEEQVSLVLEDVSLGDGLSLLLEDVGGVELDFLVRNNVLMITSREYADNWVDSRVYDVRLFELTDLNPLIAVIQTQTIMPWFETEGVGGNIDILMEHSSSGSRNGGIGKSKVCSTCWLRTTSLIPSHPGSNRSEVASSNEKGPREIPQESLL